jgi:putative glutamine amidotransferase
MAPQTRPFIGVNVDFVPQSKHQQAHIRLPIGYSDALLIAGGLPMVMPPLGKEKEINAFLDRISGFVLCGGGLDLDPRKHGLPTHPAVRLMPERRDENDRMLVRLLLERKLPILAIGLGLQQLNVACGGTLCLHLPEEMPRGIPHFDPSGGPHRHIVLLEQGTRLDEIYGGGELRINSSHHQAVRQVGEGFRKCASSPDGVIEAIEATDPNWFCIGVQWHPESETASALDMQLFECFVQACVRACQPLQLAA